MRKNYEIVTGIAIVILCVLGTMGIGKVTYIVGILICAMFVFLSGGRVPSKMTYFPYAPLLLYGFIVSTLLTMSNSITLGESITGLIDFSNPLLFLFIGGVLHLFYKSNSFLRYVTIAGVIISLIQAYLLLSNVTSTDSIDYLRWEMMPTPDIIPLTLVLLIYKKQLKVYISDNMARFAFIITSFSFVVSFSRTLLLEFIVYIAVFSINSRLIKKNIIVILRIIIFMLIVYLLLINSHFFNLFIDKFVNSSAEISTQNDWNQQLTISNNWRGYEIYSATNQFNSYGIFNKIFGEGVGSPIYVGSYARYVGVDGVTIPYLHNSYYTVLIKMGYFGLIYLILFFVINFVFYLKKSFYNIRYMLAAMMIAAIAISTQFNQGFIVMGHDAVLLIVLGYFSGYDIRIKGRERQHYV